MPDSTSPGERWNGGSMPLPAQGGILASRGVRALGGVRLLQLGVTVAAFALVLAVTFS
jgi:hypothetical protein